MLVFARNAICLSLAIVSPLWGMPCRLAVAMDGSAAVDPARAARLAANEVEAIPVVLGKDKMLHGVVKTKEGIPAEKATVVLGVNGKPVGRVVADEKGRFKFGPLKAGKYQVATKDAAAMLAVYSLDSAPDAAEKEIEVSQPAMIARGQSPGGLLKNPWFIGLVVAAAIAIPLAIALADDDDDAS